VLRKLTTGLYGELWSSTFVSRRRHAEWNEWWSSLSLRQHFSHRKISISHTGIAYCQIR